MKTSEEILALTVAILRLNPNYLKYRIADYEVELKWSLHKLEVEVFYKFNDVVIYGVKAAVLEKQHPIKISVKMVPVFKSSGLDEEITNEPIGWFAGGSSLPDMKGRTTPCASVEKLYLLLSVIAKANFQNDKEPDDTEETITRNW